MKGVMKLSRDPLLTVRISNLALVCCHSPGLL